MDNFEKDMKKQVLDLLTKEVQGQGTSKEKIDTQNAMEIKQGDKSGKGSTCTTTVAQEKLDLCPVCQTKADKTCGGCKFVSYCSVEHQRLDWKTHKKCCSPFIIKETGTMGKGWIATRDLPADTILLEELPAFWYATGDSLDSPCCLTCEIEMNTTENKDRKCSVCSWPICSEKCEKSSLHAENECKFFSAHKIKPAMLGGEHVILIIRANGLKLRNKELFDKIMELEDSKDIPHVNDDFRDVSQRYFASYANLLSQLQNLTAAECAKLWRICLINSFQLKCGKLIGHMVLLYLQLSRMNHSCTPNCTFAEGTPPDFKMRVRTAVPVKKGDSLTILLYQKLRMLPTLVRQQYLQNEMGFICKCERCLDPTELGTFISGIKCQKCRVVSKNLTADSNSGYFLPENPLDLSLDTVFKCNGCGERKLFFLLKTSLPFDIQRVFDLDPDEIIENPEDFLAKYESRGNFLHKNHYLIHTLVENIIPPSEEVDKLNKLELERVIRRMKNILSILGMLSPGLCDRKTDLMFELMLAICNLLNTFFSQLSPDEIQKLVATALICYKGALNYFKNDTSVESQWMPKQLEEGMSLLKTGFSRWMDPSI